MSNQAHDGALPGALPAPPRLRRAITLWPLLLYGLGEIVGAGIYVAVGAVIERAGSATPLSFLIAGISAGRMIRRVDGPATALVLRTGVRAAAVLAPLQLVLGDHFAEHAFQFGDAARQVVDRLAFGIGQPSVIQAPSLGELHDQEREPLVFADIVNLHDVRVMEPRHRLRFAPKTGQIFGAGVATPLKHFQGDESA